LGMCVASSAFGQEGKPIVVEGRVEGIAEIDPPRLYLRVGETRQTIVVPLKTAKVTWKGRRVEFNDLRPKDRVRVIGTPSKPGKKGPITAREIKILNDIGTRLGPKRTGDDRPPE